MIKRTFLDKTNTIKKGSYENFGLYPICMLNYGLETTRFLVHFDIDDIKSWVSDKEKGETCHHYLKMTNCGSIDLKKYGLAVPSNDANGEKKRAVSFTVYAFPIEEEWDEGIGFDSEKDFWLSGTSSRSSEGSSWFYAKSGYRWLKNGCIGDTVDASEAIAIQKFDHGNEDLCLDITDYVNMVISGECENNGLCILFDPVLENGEVSATTEENSEVMYSDYDKCGNIVTTRRTLSSIAETPFENSKLTQYVGFFGNKTNTFFEPVVESRIDDYIKDDRFDFAIKKPNRLYLYCCSNGDFLNLDHDPTCSVEGANVVGVTKQDKGVYYATVLADCDPDTILYDEWSDIMLEDGTEIDNIEMEFVTHPSQSIFSIGPDMPRESIQEPSLSGMNDDELLNKGDIRKIDIKFRFPYTTNYKSINNAQYRIYTKDKNREYTVIDWDGINNAGNINYFIIKADELVPGDYFVDIRVKTKSQVKTFKEKLKFKKANDITLIRR